MKIAVMKERRADERRVAATPETVKKFVNLCVEVVVEAGAGICAHISDNDFKEAGAAIAADAAATLAGADENKLMYNAASSDGRGSGRSIRLYALGEVTEDKSVKLVLY